MFFEKSDNFELINRAASKAETIASTVDDKNLEQQLKIIAQILTYIKNNPKEWSLKCEFNIENIGEDLISELSKFCLKGDSIELDDIYWMLYRFLCEYDFLIGSEKQLNSEARSIRKKIEDDIGNLSEKIRSQIIYAAYMMPASITKEIMNDTGIISLRDFKKNSRKRRRA